MYVLMYIAMSLDIVQPKTYVLLKEAFEYSIALQKL